MNIYMVSATLTVPAWIEVEAEDEADALEAARTEYRPQDFQWDTGGAVIEFNVDPAVVEMP